MKAEPARTALALALVGALALLPACDKQRTPVAPGLSATCSATPAAGPAPLTVSFTLNVSGAQGTFSVRISYGDGGSGSDAGAPHTYATPGSYTVGFTVSTATQSALCSTSVRVDPRPTPSPSAPATNQPPNAVFHTVPEAAPGNFFSGTAPRAIQFNMCPSSDPEHDPLRFRMDFQGDGIWDVEGETGADCRRTYTYPAGSFSPRMCVTDLLSSLAPAHPDQCKTYGVRLSKPAS